MLFRVDPSSAAGLAEQIAAQVRGALVGGRLAPGDRLPPAREVAAGLDMNIHTVLRGYAMLRDEALVDLRRGRGAVVRPDVDIRALTVQRSVDALAAEALRLGWTPDRAADAVRHAMTDLADPSPADHSDSEGRRP